MGVRQFSWRVVAFATVLAAFVGSGTAVVASHQFSDVSDGHPFHDEIAALASAGVAQGFADGTYRPSSNVTRQAMAAFLERGLGRVTRRAGSGSVAPGAQSTIAEVTIDSGAAGAGSGHVLLLGQADATAFSGCPCTVQLSLIDAEGAFLGDARFDVTGAADEVGNSEAGGTVVGLASVPADSVRAFRLVAATSDSDVPSISLFGDLTALYVPFGPDADGTLTYDFSCPPDDGYEQDDTRSDATVLRTGSAFGVALRGIACPADSDHFVQFVPSGRTIDVLLDFAHAQGDLDLYLENSTGTVLAAAETKSDDETLSFNVTQSGSYYLRVHLHQDAGAPGNPYGLQARVRTTGAAAPEPPPATPEAVSHSPEQS